jgi:hypothetical protein
MRQRRAKRARVVRRVPDPRVDPDPYDSPPDDDDRTESNEVRQGRRTARSVLARLSRDERLVNTDAEEGAALLDLPSDEEFALLAPFCCAVCRCSRARQARIPADWLWFEPHEGTLWHRRCCHGHYGEETNEHWTVPYLSVYHAKTDLVEAALQREEVLGDANPTEDPQQSSSGTDLEWITERELFRQYEVSKSQEAQLYNDDSEAHSVSILHTHPDYIQGIVQPFRTLVLQRQQDPSLKHGLTVLDMFAGIGTATVCLKRLGLQISKIVRVEHDHISTHVYQENHDCSYNPTLADHGDIKHVYCQKFEDFRDNLEHMAETHGPFDLVIGGPPCVDYSAVNARRQGAEGVQGRYTIEFGHLIRKLERLQNPHPLFYLVENVFLRGDDLAKVRDAFGIDWDPVVLDSLYLSPCRRKRHFITNIPLTEIDFQAEASYSSPRSCLEEGFSLPAHIVDGETTAKASCFMASSTRIDERQSLRMYVFKEPKNDNGRSSDRTIEEGRRYHGRPMSVGEREAMMGYPRGYVEHAVRTLFSTLTEDGLSKLFIGQSWRESLDSKLHHFAGNYHAIPEGTAYRFAEPKSGFEEHILKMTPPQTGTGPEFFDAQEYSKHLIGLAFSVPVVEHLLGPLRDLFECREYEGYTDVPYEWETDCGPLRTTGNTTNGYSLDKNALARDSPTAIPDPVCSGGDHVYPDQSGSYHED